jgi:hypothetical protein
VAHNGSAACPAAVGVTAVPSPEEIVEEALMDLCLDQEVRAVMALEEQPHLERAYEAMEMGLDLTLPRVKKARMTDGQPCQLEAISESRLEQENITPRESLVERRRLVRSYASPAQSRFPNLARLLLQRIRPTIEEEEGNKKNLEEID